MRRLLKDVPDPIGQPLVELVAEFGGKASTQTTRRTMVTMFSTALGRPATVDDLAGKQLASYIADLAGYGLAEGTVKVTVRFFRRLCKAAFANGLLASLPEIKAPEFSIDAVDPRNDLTVFCPSEIAEYFESKYVPTCLAKYTAETVSDHRNAVRACLSNGIESFDQLTPAAYVQIESWCLFKFWSAAYNAGRCKNWPYRSPSGLYELAGTVANAGRHLMTLERVLGRSAFPADLNSQTLNEMPNEDAKSFVRKVWRIAFDAKLVEGLPPRAAYSKSVGDTWEGLTTIIHTAPPLVMDKIPEASKTHEIADFLANHYYPCRPGLSDDTRHQYGLSVRKFGRYLNRTPVLSDLNNQTVGSFLIALNQTTQSAAGTIGKDREQLLAIWRDVYSRGLLLAGPLIKPPAEPERIPTALTIDQVKQLRRAIPLVKGDIEGQKKCDLLRAVFSIQYATAARLGAALDLTCGDIDGNVITLRAETRKGGREPIVKAVPDWVLNDIDKIRKPKRERLFPVQATVAKFSTIYSRLYELAEVPRPKGKSSHLLRSTHATLLWLAGGDPTTSLGHASEETTRKHYLDPRHKPDTTHTLLPFLKGSESNGK